MPRILSLLCAYAATAAAAPALVWTSGHQDSMISSEPIVAAEIMPQDQGVVFFLERGSDGTESLTAWADQLPQTTALAATSATQHHFVLGVTSAHLLARTVNSVDTAELSLQDYVNLDRVIEDLLETSRNRKGKIAMRKQKQARALQQARVLFVRVELSAETAPQLDAAIAHAVATQPQTVVVASRSLEEVKYERERSMYRQTSLYQSAAKERMLQNQSRRLEEDAEQQQANMNYQGNNNDQVMVLVSMTPNIMAGILFTLLFATIAYIGITCMGAISGQDVYVDKMPSIGREA